MFRGNHPARVDEKGRLKLPAEFKRRIDEEYGEQFYITSKDGKVAEIHPLKEWEKFEEKLAAIPNFNPAKKKLLDRLNYFGQVARMDEQGSPRYFGSRPKSPETWLFSGCKRTSKSLTTTASARTWKRTRLRKKTSRCWQDLGSRP
jgi:bifunctional DNA-binding transcriptional regulator/antitoxin component of YhaV-PrlF toxin-antitoxin module